MSEQINGAATPPPMPSFPIMTPERFSTARHAVIEAIRNDIGARPTLESFIENEVSRTDERIVKILIGGVFLCLAISFWISSGKMIAATHTVLGDLPIHYPVIGSAWVFVSTFGMVLLGEIATMLLMLVAALIVDSPRVRIFLRVLAGLTAMLGVVANVSVTLQYPNQQMFVFQMMITIAMPIMVLALSYTLEQILIKNSERRYEAIINHRAACRDYDMVFADPSRFGEFDHRLILQVQSDLKNTQGKAAWYKHWSAQPGALAQIAQMECHVHSGDGLTPLEQNPFLALTASLPPSSLLPLLSSE